jgi:hypothetical protein
MWLFLTLKFDDIPIYIHYLFDDDHQEEIDADEIGDVIKIIHGSSYSESLKQSVAKWLKTCDKVDSKLFAEFVKSNPIILQPIKQFQSNLIHLICGEDFWATARSHRYKYHQNSLEPHYIQTLRTKLIRSHVEVNTPRLCRPTNLTEKSPAKKYLQNASPTLSSSSGVSSNTSPLSPRHETVSTIPSSHMHHSASTIVTPTVVIESSLEESRRHHHSNSNNKQEASDTHQPSQQELPHKKVQGSRRNSKQKDGGRLRGERKQSGSRFGGGDARVFISDDIGEALAQKLAEIPTPNTSHHKPVI